MLKWLNNKIDHVIAGAVQGIVFVFVLWYFDANVTINF